MVKETAPTTADINKNCPAPGLIAKRKDHFGRVAWEFECIYAKEVSLESGKIAIHCSERAGKCCVDNGKDYFVNSQQISPLKSFLETSMKYFNR